MVLQELWDSKMVLTVRCFWVLLSANILPLDCEIASWCSRDLVLTLYSTDCKVRT